MILPAFREAMHDGRRQLGFCAMYPAPGIIERVGADWDWIWIDGQHGQLAYNDILAMVRAANLVKRPAFVRVPGHEFGPIGRALDMAPEGIIVPCVDTPQQAEAVVNAAKLPPLGKRSYGGRRPIDLHGRAYSDRANDDVMLVCQIESPEAIANVDAIACIPGVDALFFGSDDVTLRRGRAMNAPPDAKLLDDDLRAVIAACRRHGKIGVTVGASSEVLTLSHRLGYGMIVAGGDAVILAAGSAAMSNEARKRIAEPMPAVSMGQRAG